VVYFSPSTSTNMIAIEVKTREMETSSRNSGNTTDVCQYTEERIRGNEDPRDGYWERIAWFVHLEVGQRVYFHMIYNIEDIKLFAESI